MDAQQKRAAQAPAFGSNGNEEFPPVPGLTTREYFAAQALAALAHRHISGTPEGAIGGLYSGEIADLAVELADALIIALND